MKIYTQSLQVGVLHCFRDTDYCKYLLEGFFVSAHVEEGEDVCIMSAICSFVTFFCFICTYETGVIIFILSVVHSLENGGLVR